MTTGSKLIELSQKNNETETVETKISAKFWLNIGVRLADGTFISLPVGIAIDGQAEKLAQINAKKPASTPKMQLLRQLQAELIEAMSSVASLVPAGQGVAFTEFPSGMQLSFEIRHVNDSDKTEVAPTTLNLLSRKVA